MPAGLWIRTWSGLSSYLAVLSRRPVYPALFTAISLPFLLFHRIDLGNT
ncbi:unnamed protein product [Arabidopsis halleri]